MAEPANVELQVEGPGLGAAGAEPDSSLFPGLALSGAALALAACGGGGGTQTQTPTPTPTPILPSRAQAARFLD